MLQAREVEVLQDRQHLDQGGAAAGGRVGEYAQTAIGPRHLGREAGSVIAEVVPGDEGAARFQVGADLVPEGALVEFFGTPLGETLQAARHVRVAHHLADLEEAALRVQVDFGACLGGADAGQAVGDSRQAIAKPAIAHMGDDGDPFPGRLDGGGDQFRPR